LDPTYQSYSIWQIIAHLGLLGLMGLTTYGSITLWKLKKAVALEFSILSFVFIVLGMLELFTTYSSIHIYPASFNYFLALDLFPFLFTIVFTRRLARDLLDSYKLRVKSMENLILEKQLKIERIEKTRLQEQLQFTNNDLSDFGLEITRMKSFTESIYTKLTALKTDTNQKEIDQLISFTKSNLQIDKELAQFQNKVETINHKFLSKLKIICPELSKNELQLASLLRLNLNTKEIAAVKNISPDSVKVLRHRLRKKLELPAKANLSNYISNI
jgi:DNA-binding CsgD family transcriptional regulator